MNTAYLALGSNLGDRAAVLAEGLRRLEASGELEVARVSSVYETAPVGITEQPFFLNLVAEIRTTLLPEKLLAHSLSVETSLGRVRRERWGPRTIDIDLLWYAGETIRTNELTLPHPRMAERSFVLVPLAEIAPHLLLDGETAASRAVRCAQEGLNKLGPLSTSPAQHRA